MDYLLTFRTYGSWLHGDGRSSVDVHGKNIYGTPEVAANEKLERIMRDNMRGEPIVLDGDQRAAIEDAISEVCAHRGYFLQAVNVRSNHVHAVVSAEVKPGKIVQSLKAYATRRLREKSLIEPDIDVWSRGQSGRYLWKPHHVALAIDYVLYSQGDAPFTTETETRT